MSLRIFWKQERFAFLLTTLTVFVLVYPALPEGQISDVFLRLFYTAIVGAGVWVLDQTPRIVLPGRVLGTAALVFTWGSLLIGTGWFAATGRVVLGVFFLLTTWQLVLYVARTKSADGNTIYASVCAYAMIGIGFAIAYEIVEILYPGAFALTNPDQVERTGEFVYFSFVTQTTLGYGEITPIIPFARSLTIVQAVLGQFYVAIVVARLISLVVASHRSE